MSQTTTVATNDPPAMTVAIHPDSGSPGPAAAEEQDQGAEQRQRHDDVGGVHAVAQPLSEWMSSAVAAARRRNMATMIARPTTTSAAATTSTKNTDDLAADVVRACGRR